jgi:hypothetical protein
MMHARTTILLAGLAPLFGCGLEEVAEGGETDEIPPAVQAALDESCATSSSCHGAGSNLPVFSAPESSSILTSGGAGGPLVTIGDLENSYIAQKILDESPVSGVQMPPSQQSPNDSVNLAIIIGWIAGVPVEGGETGGDGDGDGDMTGDGDGDGDGDTMCFIELPLPAAPSFATDIWPILQNRCGTMGCHANLSNPLMPDEATAYTNLIGMPANTAMANYVEPDDPDTSYLWHKVAGTQLTVPGGAGSTMPFGGELCSLELQAIYAWILTGAAE